MSNPINIYNSKIGIHNPYFDSTNYVYQLDIFFKNNSKKTFNKITNKKYTRLIQINDKINNESKNNKLAFRGDIKYTQISEFYETQRWILPPYGRTDIHVNGIESIGAKAWVENNFNHFGWYAGLELSTTHARGIALTYDVGETQQSEATYSSFNQRDNTSLKGLIGANYDITKNWSIDADVKLGDGEYIGVGFSRRF